MKVYIINDMFIDKSRNLWLGTSEGLFFYEYNNLTSIEKLQVHSQLLDKRISVIEQGPDSTFWIGSDSGLYWFKNFDNILTIKKDPRRE